eukprot:7603145-Lingulodinium_polyedra.AAC.1
MAQRYLQVHRLRSPRSPRSLRARPCSALPVTRLDVQSPTAGPACRFRQHMARAGLCLCAL